MANLSPVVFFFFNRPWTARRVFARIREARPAQLILVGDGPRAQVPGEEQEVLQLRREIENAIDWPARVETDYAPRNLGMARRLATAIERALSRHGRAVFVEDDCLPSPSFFSYAESMLDRYEREPRVLSISGTYFLGRSHRPVDIGFTHFPVNWGWATWARAWEGYDMELKGWDDSFIDEIANEGIIPSFKPEVWKETFHSIIRNPFFSWDGQFWLLSLKRRGLSVFPYRNQITNIGYGPRSTNQGSPRWCKPAYQFERPLVLPETFTTDAKYEKYLQYEFYSNTITWRNIRWRVQERLGKLWNRRIK
jgi:hypothetical protein